MTVREFANWFLDLPLWKALIYMCLVALFYGVTWGLIVGSTNARARERR